MISTKKARQVSRRHAKVIAAKDAAEKKRKPRKPQHKHTDEEDAMIVGALLAGQGIRELERQFGVDRTYIFRLKEKIDPDVIRQVHLKRLEQFPELVANALESILLTLTSTASKIRTEEGWAWIKQHSPAQFDTLIGVLTDKGFYLLEARSPVFRDQGRQFLRVHKNRLRASQLSLQQLQP